MVKFLPRIDHFVTNLPTIGHFARIVPQIVASFLSFVLLLLVFCTIIFVAQCLSPRSVTRIQYRD